MKLTGYDFGAHTIQDPIHGGIMFGPIEKGIIDHPSFQRLHGLRQNSLLYLIFPSANHTRFDHSVGVMFLADRLLESILANQRRICMRSASRTEYQEPYRVDGEIIEQALQRLEGNQYYKLILRIAALFHDIGHGPLSHLFDELFPTPQWIDSLVQEVEYKHIHERIRKITDTSKPIRHEIMSCAVATSTLLQCREAFGPYDIDVQEVIADVCAIIDEKMEPSRNFKIELCHPQKLFHDVLSSDLDVDRMDYLLRDSHMAGVKYGIYDPSRIFKSMCFYAHRDTGDLRLAVRHSGIGALEDLLISRYEMHSQIYGHKTNRACSAMLTTIQNDLKVSGRNWYDGSKMLSDLTTMFCGLDDQRFIRCLLEEKENAEKVREIARKLFIERRLVKRVFEERVDAKKSGNTVERWNLHKAILDEHGIDAQQDVFENKGPKLNNDDYYLKVLKKHPKTNYYMVEELRNHSTVARFLPQLECIYRIYCESSQVEKAKSLLPS
nr:HD domain-containing protein [Nitrosomonas nitrosa]